MKDKRQPYRKYTLDAEKFFYLYKLQNLKACSYDLKIPYNTLYHYVCLRDEKLKKRYLTIKAEKLKKQKEKFLLALGSNLTIVSSLVHGDINRISYRYWLKKDKDFKAKVDEVIKNKNKYERYIK